MSVGSPAASATKLRDKIAFGHRTTAKIEQARKAALENGGIYQTEGRQPTCSDQLFIRQKLAIDGLHAVVSEVEYRTDVGKGRDRGRSKYGPSVLDIAQQLRISPDESEVAGK